MQVCFVEGLRVSRGLVVVSRRCGRRRFKQSRTLMHRCCKQSTKTGFPKWLGVVLGIVLVLFAVLIAWWGWTHACRVGEAANPGPAGFPTKHLKCDHCATWFSSTSAASRHNKRFHQTLAQNSSSVEVPGFVSCIVAGF